MKTLVNEECILCGLCEEIVPDVFTMGDEKAEVKVDVVPEGLEIFVEEAADSCPVSAIEIEV